MSATPHDTAWRLDRLIGRATEQEALEELLRSLQPQQISSARPGRTVVITGPIGSGRRALAHFALRDSLLALPASAEIDLTMQGIAWLEPNDGRRDGRRLRHEMIRSLADDAIQRLPLPVGPLLAMLKPLLLADDRAAPPPPNTLPTPEKLLPLVTRMAGQQPFALHLAGLDDPNLNERWIELVAALVRTIHDQWPVLLLISLESERSLVELAALRGEYQPPTNTPDRNVQRRMQRVLIEFAATGKLRNLHLGPTTVSDVQRYIHEPAEPDVAERLHELAGGWPLMIQTLWQDWRDSAQKAGGGGTAWPVIERDSEMMPWRLTRYGLTATAHTSALLDSLIRQQPDVLPLMQSLLDDDEATDEDARAELQYILSVAALEGPDFTGAALAEACGYDFDGVLEDVLDALYDANILCDAPQDEIPSFDGPRTIYRYRFTSPVWWELLRGELTGEDEREAAANLARAIETCYSGPLPWLRYAVLTKLWELAGDEAGYLNRQHVLEQRTYIWRLWLRAQFAEERAQRHGTWIQAHEAWMKVGDQMRGYVAHEEIFAAYEQARHMAEKADSPYKIAETWMRIGFWSNRHNDHVQAETAAEQGFAILGERTDPDSQRVRGWLFNILGRAYTERKDFDQALLFLEEAHKLLEAYGDKEEVAHVLYGLGNLYMHSYDFDQALLLFKQAHNFFQFHGSPIQLGRILQDIGVLHVLQGNLDQAIQILEQAYRIVESHGSPYELANNLYYLASAHYQRGDYALALHSVRRALVIQHEIQAPEINEAEELEREILDAKAAQETRQQEQPDQPG